MRALAISLCATLAFLLAGCVAGPRSASSPYIPAPVDIDSQDFAEELRVMAERELEFTSDNYLLGAGDEISITMVGREDLFQNPVTDAVENRFAITQNPLLILPHVGAITVHGKTPAMLEEELRASFSRVIKNPEPIVTVEKFNSNQVVVLGSVLTPGRYPLQSRDTLLEVIFKAGGLTYGGDSGGLPPAQFLKVYRSPQIERRLAPTAASDELAFVDESMRRREIIVPLDEFILGGDLSYNIPVMPDDVIYIPPAGTVSVHGQVNQPRVVFLGPGLRTVGQVLTEVGGMKFRAASQIEVVRMEPDGTVRSFYLDGRKVMTRREIDFTLRDNDRIYVYSNGWRAFLDGLGSIFKATATTGVNATYSPTP